MVNYILVYLLLELNLPYMSIQITEAAASAARFVNSTNAHIFLTGNAGTGKTTFLRGISESTHKRHLILAPTGIAALNAGGVTIHSQFLLPPGTFLPGQNVQVSEQESNDYLTQYNLTRRHPLNAKRREVLRNIDLLIIDEVSMLRADLLDAIDFRLRQVKRNYREPFGGVQLLMIGDLLQLPPVVKEWEWGRLREFYNSPYFFDSQGLKQSGFVYLELDKVFRQQDQEFIRVLNALRNNTIDEKDVDILNTRHQEGEIEQGVITICTHNNQADRLNRDELNFLGGRSHYFEADIEGDFPERIFPVPESIELKVGAQVMFMKNDTKEFKYFNGKIATVVEIKDDGVEVEFHDNGDAYFLRRETWENKKYKVDEKSKELNEEFLGSFSQYPVKLAWAITVHKSQGLTFEKAVIDVGNAFAPGQVYVALSRLTSLEGLILKTKISRNVVSSDQKVVEFSKLKDQQGKLDELLKASQQRFLYDTLNSAFNFEQVLKQIEAVHKKHDTSQFEDLEMRNAIANLTGRLDDEKKNTGVFRNQLLRLLQESDHEGLSARVAKGVDYYRDFVKAQVKFILIHLGEVDQLSRVKAYFDAVSELDVMFMKKWEELDKVEYLVACISKGEDVEKQKGSDESRKGQRENLLFKVEQHLAENPKNLGTKTGKRRKKKSSDPSKPKKEKGQTYMDTFDLYDKGLNVREIAKKRDLKDRTIESHLARGIKVGKISLEKVMEKKDIGAIRGVLGDKEESSKDVFERLKGKYAYSQIQMVMADRAYHLQEGLEGDS